jgi:hypothetical protein
MKRQFTCPLCRSMQKVPMVRPCPAPLLDGGDSDSSGLPQGHPESRTFRMLALPLSPEMSKKSGSEVSLVGTESGRGPKKLA